MNKSRFSRTPETSQCSGLAGLLSPRLFKALADPKRISLLVRLAEARESRTVSQVAEGSGVDLSVVSRHLAMLREAGIIGCSKQGKEVRCWVQTNVIAQILRDLADALEACCPDGRCPSGPTRSNAAKSPAPRGRSPRHTGVSK